MRRALAAGVLALALAGCASPQADLQTAVAELTDAVNAGDQAGTVSAADEVLTLAEQQRDDNGDEKTDRIEQYATAIKEAAGTLGTPTPSPTPEAEETTEAPEPTRTREPEPEQTTEEPEVEETTEAPEPSRTRSPRPSPSEVVEVPLPDDEPTEEPESAATPTPASFSSPQPSQAVRSTPRATPAASSAPPTT